MCHLCARRCSCHLTNVNLFTPHQCYAENYSSSHLSRIYFASKWGSSGTERQLTCPGLHRWSGAGGAPARETWPRSLGPAAARRLRATGSSVSKAWWSLSLSLSPTHTHTHTHPSQVSTARVDSLSVPLRPAQVGREALPLVSGSGGGRLHLCSRENHSGGQVAGDTMTLKSHTYHPRSRCVCQRES